MRTILSLLATFLLILAVLLGAGIAVGALVNWIFPAIDFGVAALTGVIAVAISIHFIGRVMSSIPAGPEETEKGDSDERFILVEPLPISRRKRRKPFRQ